MQLSYEFLNQHYTKNISLRELARQAKLNPNQIRRAMLKMNIKPKSRSQAMIDGYNSGAISREREPHSEERKEKIALASKAAIRKPRTTQTKNNKFLKKDLTYLRGNAARENRNATIIGSKFERMLENQLTKQGIRVKLQYKIDRYKIDIFVPSNKTAIEIDGIFHREPVFGHDRLVKTLKKDTEKNNFLKLKGIHLIRVMDNQKRPSLANAINVSKQIIEILNETKKSYVFKVLEIN